MTREFWTEEFPSSLSTLELFGEDVQTHTYRKTLLLLLKPHLSLLSALAKTTGLE